MVAFPFCSPDKLLGKDSDFSFPLHLQKEVEEDVIMKTSPFHRVFTSSSFFLVHRCNGEKAMPAPPAIRIPAFSSFSFAGILAAGWLWPSRESASHIFKTMLRTAGGEAEMDGQQFVNSTS